MNEVQKKNLSRVAIPVLQDAGLASCVSEHFGKSPGFIVVDWDGQNCIYLESQSARQGQECAPILALEEHGCQTLLCHHMGRGALIRCRDAGFQIHEAKGGALVSDVLKAFQAGQCPALPDSALCTHGHSQGDDHDHPHCHDH